MSDHHGTEGILSSLQSLVLVGAVCLWRVIKTLKTMPATFEASLAELAQDYQSLKDE